MQTETDWDTHTVVRESSTYCRVAEKTSPPARRQLFLVREEHLAQETARQSASAITSGHSLMRSESVLDSSSSPSAGRTGEAARDELSEVRDQSPCGVVCHLDFIPSSGRNTTGSQEESIRVWRGTDGAIQATIGIVVDQGSSRSGEIPGTAVHHRCVSVVYV